MAVQIAELGSFTNGVTGNTTLNLNGTETPVLIEFWATAKSGSEAVVIVSGGTVDITNGNATWYSVYGDSTGSQTKNGSGSSTASSCLQHYDRVAGTITKVLDVEFVSVTSGSFVLNLLTANSNYRVFFRVYA